MSVDRVLLTGASGFIAQHILLQLLSAGHAVRATVRSEAKAESVRRILRGQGADLSRLEFAPLDLLADDGWDAAMAGCRFVLHTASPFPSALPRDRYALVPPARDGTLRVVDAAIRAGAERLVLTSSVAAIYYGHPNQAGRAFTEADFTNIESPATSAYSLSKTLAEQAAWAQVAGSSLELAVINPSVVLGPLLGPEVTTSTSLIRLMLRGRLPIVPNVSLGLVDVRDVAAAHLLAMTVPEAAGRRFIVSAGSRSLREVGKVLAEVFPSYGWKLPRATLPDSFVRAAALLSPQAAQIVPELGAPKVLVAAAAERLLGLSMRSPEEAIRATGESLLAHRLA